MIIGHYAVALATKKFTPKLSLGTLFLASQFLDILCLLFLFLGWEKVQALPNAQGLVPIEFSHYPYSHSLVMAFAWSSVLFAVARLFKRTRIEALCLFALCLSHWFLDVVVHRQDLSVGLQTAGPQFGLGLWDSPVSILIFEGMLFLAGVWLYLKHDKRKFKISFLGLMLLAVGTHIALFFLRELSSVDWSAYAGLAALQASFVLLAYKIDAH